MEQAACICKAAGACMPVDVKHTGFGYIRSMRTCDCALCAQVLTCYSKKDGKKYAAKTIPKDPRRAERQYLSVLNEVRSSSGSRADQQP